MPRGNTKDTNIDIEAFDQYKSLYNMDSLKYVYKIKAYVEIEDSKVQTQDVIFIDFNNPFLDENKHFILANCEIKQFNPRWQYRPNYLSYDMYGTTSFAYLLQFINNCMSIMDFDFDYVKVPTKKVIKELIISNQRLYPDRSKIKNVRFI